MSGEVGRKHWEPGMTGGDVIRSVVGTGARQSPLP